MSASSSRAASASKSGRIIARSAAALTSVRVRRRAPFTVFAAISLLASLLAVTLATHPASAGPLPVMTGYVPLPADQFHTALGNAGGASIVNDHILQFTVGITNAGDGAVITYDQWEDGYEPDLANPVQATTLVFGDNNTANGDASTVASCAARCASDLLPAGAVLLFKNQILTPRVPANQLFDGRDKVGSTRGFALVAGGYPVTNGSVISGVVSSFDTTKYGVDYVVPVGENTFAALGSPAGTNNSMATASLIISAAEDGTVVNIDKDANGTFDQTATINQGEVVMASGGVMQGAHVVASKPVQVHLSTGDPGVSFESRWFTLFPTPLLSSDYMSPVGSSVANFLTILYVHNPGSSTITVTPTCTGCAGTLTVLAHQTQSFATPAGQAVRLQSSGGQPFVAIGATGAQSGAAPGTASDISSTWDSGFTLIPTGLLTSQAVLSWAPGNSNPVPSSQTSDFEDNPVWITTLVATTLYVDFDGDPATGSIPGTANCLGENFDTSIPVTALASTRIVDLTDGDMTGARVAACDGTKIAGAWGEDPSTAPAGAPGFDAGYTIIPTTVMVVDKTAGPAIDSNGDGRIGPGDTVAYDIAIADAGALSFSGVAVDDAIPLGTTYVPGSVTFVNGASSVPISDDVVPPALTAYPLDAGDGGSPIPDIAAGNTVHVLYRVSINDVLPPGLTAITNVINVDSSEADASDVVVTVMATSDLSLTKTLTTTPTFSGQNAVYRVTLTNSGPDAVAGVEVTDAVPTGTTFVSAARSQGSYSSGTGIWTGISLANGASATLDLTVRVNALTVDNFAQVTKSGSADADSQPGENTLGTGNPPDQDDEATVSLTVLAAPDLSLTKTASAVTHAGDTVTYTVTLANTGLGAATGIVVTDQLPAGAAFVSAVPSQGGYIAGTGLWTVGGVNAAASATLTITAVVTAPGAVTNSAEVTAETEIDGDSTPNNHNATEDDQASAGITSTGTSIGDRVWYDVDNNTIQDGGEPGIPGVTLGIRWAGPDGILNTLDDVLTATTTDSAGAWTATGLPSGSYIVTASALPNGLTTPTKDLDGTGTPGTATFTLTGGTNRTDVDFGYRGSGVVGDRVFNDLDTSGGWNPGEGIDGVSVDARWEGFDGIAGNGDDIVYPTATTSAGGLYSFGNLPAGQITITVATGTLPANLLATVDRDGGADSTSTVNLAAGQTRNDQDFGYVAGHVALFVTKSDGAASVTPGGTVAYTLSYGNGSGATKLATNVVLTETVPANVTFNAGASTAGWVCTPNGNAGSSCTLNVGTVGIGATGAATFAVTLASTVPAGTTLISNTATVTDDGSNGTDLDLSDNSGSDTTPVVAAPDLSVTKSDAGITTSAGGLVAYTLAYANTGNEGATGVVLTEAVPAGTTFVSGSSTAGWVCTPNISAGSVCTLTIGAVAAGGSGSATFAVRVSFPFVALSPLSNTASIGDDGTNGTDPTPADNTSSDTTPVAVGALGDKVFIDSNNDAAFGAGEGLAGVTVHVVWPGPDAAFGNGDDVTVASTTDATGTWTITGLPVGPLHIDIVTASLPPGLTNTVDPDGGTANTAMVTLTSGQTNLNQDFGYRGTGIIGDTVFSDTNSDGIQQAGEPGLGNVTVTIDNAGHTVMSSTTTSGAGTYHFTDLTPGTYTITVTPVTGQTATTPTSFVITLPPDVTNDAADFGFVPPVPPAPGTIGDTVYTDTNGNGMQDAGEPGRSGVTVTLRIDADNNGSFETIGATQLTDVAGHYSFANLPPGSYEVVVAPQAGQFATTPIAVAVQLSSGDTVLTADFGQRDTAAPTGSIGTTVFDDTNGNGTQDLGELGVAAVTLTLRQDTDGDGVAETVAGNTATDTSGAYSFAGLPPGSYTVTVTPPSGRFVTTAATQAVALSAGGTVTTADFGLNSQSAPPPGVITGSVWSDTDRDQVFDSSEAGVNGATVTLRSDADGDGVYDTVVATTTSAGNGDYSFITVSPGRYRAVITPPAGQSVTTVGSYVVDISAGATVSNIDFGLATPGPVPFDLWVDKSLVGTAQQGKTAMWLLVVGNNGIAASPDPLTLTDVLPAGLTYNNASGAGWTCTALGQTVTCSLARSLAVGATAELWIQTVVGEDVVGQVVNRASVAANGVELTQSNNVGQGTAEVESVTVAAPIPTPTTTPTTPAITLPGTGSDSLGLVLIGLMMIVTGAILLAVRRRTTIGN